MSRNESPRPDKVRALLNELMEVIHKHSEQEQLLLSEVHSAAFSLAVHWSQAVVNLSDSGNTALQNRMTISKHYQAVANDMAPFADKSVH